MRLYHPNPSSISLFCHYHTALLASSLHHPISFQQPVHEPLPPGRLVSWQDNWQSDIPFPVSPFSSSSSSQDGHQQRRQLLHSLHHLWPFTLEGLYEREMVKGSLGSLAPGPFFVRVWGVRGWCSEDDEATSEGCEVIEWVVVFLNYKRRRGLYG